jgi:hypothetical protein
MSEESANIPPLWNEMHQKHYDVSFQEVVLDAQISRWKNFDLISRYLIAITTSSSAVSGWYFWQQPGFSIVWSVLAGVAALLSILYSVVPIAQHLKDGNRAYSELHPIRVAFDELRLKYQMGVNDESEIRERLYELNKRFIEVCDHSPRFP